MNNKNMLNLFLRLSFLCLTLFSLFGCGSSEKKLPYITKIETESPIVAGEQNRITIHGKNMDANDASILLYKQVANTLSAIPIDAYEINSITQKVVESANTDGSIEVLLTPSESIEPGEYIIGVRNRNGLSTLLSNENTRIKILAPRPVITLVKIEEVPPEEIDIGRGTRKLIIQGKHFDGLKQVLLYSYETDNPTFYPIKYSAYNVYSIPPIITITDTSIDGLFVPGGLKDGTYYINIETASGYGAYHTDTNHFEVKGSPCKNQPIIKDLIVNSQSNQYDCDTPFLISGKNLKQMFGNFYYNWKDGNLYFGGLSSRPDINTNYEITDTSIGPVSFEKSKRTKYCMDGEYYVYIVTRVTDGYCISSLSEGSKFTIGPTSSSTIQSTLQPTPVAAKSSEIDSII
ncbi:MAG: hypothetical protein V1859_07955 [archaeon]